MAKFKWDDDREFKFLEPLDFLGAEARWIEKQFGKNLDEFTWSESLFANALVTLRRNGVMLTLADTEDWTLGFVNDRLVPEPEDGADREDDGLDPHVPAEAPSKPSGGSGGRSSSTTSASSRGTQKSA